MPRSYDKASESFFSFFLCNTHKRLIHKKLIKEGKIKICICNYLYLR